MLGAVREAIIATDLDGRIMFWNPFAEELYGWKADEVIDRNIVETLTPSNTHEQANEIMRLVRSGKSWSGEFEVRRKDGSRFPASVTDSPIFDEQGRLIGIVGISRDLTEHKRAEDDLRRIHEETELRVRERTAELESSMVQVRALTVRLLQLQDGERRRIARELHDSVGQMLAALSLNIALVTNEKASLSTVAAHAVAENKDLVDQISQEIRTISHLLHPPLLDEVGLHSALRWFVEGFAKRSKIDVKLELPAVSERWPRETETSLFRVVQECLTNVHRHSGSSTAVVRMSRSPKLITVEIEDQGHGIPAEKQTDLSSGELAGVGLRGMQERLRQLGGVLEIRSHAGGTKVIAELPLPVGEAKAGD